MNVYDVAHYISIAQALAKEEPDGSVIKYALTSLLRAKLKPNAKELLLGEMLVLAYHYPIIVPMLRMPLRNAVATLTAAQILDFDDRLNALLENHAYHHRSDSMCWLLFFISKMKLKVADKTATRIMESKDCMALLILYKVGNVKQRGAVVSFAKKLDKTDLYELDTYWLLLYEIFLDGKIANPYGSQETAFNVMKKSKLTFFHPSVKL